VVRKAATIAISVKIHAHIVFQFLRNLNYLGPVAGPVIQANERLSFEDDLRSGGLLYCVSQ
jgi:hypothetical protein